MQPRGGGRIRSRIRYAHLDGGFIPDVFSRWTFILRLLLTLHASCCFNENNARRGQDNKKKNKHTQTNKRIRDSPTKYSRRERSIPLLRPNPRDLTVYNRWPWTPELTRVVVN